MRFLTLAQGDPVGLDLLKKLVVSRYGESPPALDSLRVTYEGRSRGKVGPFTVWARLEATAAYRFPDKMRWDFRVRMLGIIRSSFSTAYDGERVYEQRGLRAERITDPDEVKSARLRAWSETVFFVSPLIPNDEVRVEGSGNLAFKAFMPGQTDEFVLVRLNEDFSLAEIESERWDPDDRTVKHQYMRPVGELQRVDSFILPQKIQRFWDTQLFMELKPVAAETNPALDDDFFVLKSESLLDVLDEDDES